MSRVVSGLSSAVFVAVILALAGPTPAYAQANDSPRRALESTPLGALPPLALPMPAHRGRNYWGVRLQAGHRARRTGPDLSAIGAGLDLQWQGGSVFGATAGLLTRDCPDRDCDGTAWFAGTRARFNVIAGGPTLAALLGDYSATTTLGAEVGLGYAHDLTAAGSACAVDVGAPVSLAMFRHPRIVAFVTPAVAWEIACLDTDASRPTFLSNLGIGAQQVGGRGLDIYLGFQRMFRDGTGHQLGISVTYTRLP